MKHKTLTPEKQLKNKITKLLDTAKVKYKILEHKVVYTAHDAAKTTKKKLGEIAKVVLVKVEGSVIASPNASEGVAISKKVKIASSTRQSPGLLAMTKPSNYFALIVLPAGKYVDFAGIKKALKAKKVSMATEKDIIKYLKSKIGLLHPFGCAYNMKTLLDKGITKGKKLIASAGSYTHSIELSVKDFEKLVQPIRGSFSKAKK